MLQVLVADMLKTLEQEMPKRILIADDEAPIRFAVGRVVSQQGFEVSEASNGYEALATIRTGIERGLPVDLLLLDISMPGCTGEETLAELADLEHGPQVVIMTGSIERAHLERAASRNYSGILNKPFRSDKLLQAIAKVFAGKKLVMKRELVWQNA
jgi:CheY-like chemotaxis protein